MLLVSLTLRSPTAPELRPPIILQLPPHVHEPYTRAEDRYLWDNQNGDMEAVATELGRGPTSCALRLERLRNPKSSGYKRLFGSDQGAGGDGGNAKQPGLRPIKECIQRIKYGGDLDGREFHIGYRDRFRSQPCEAPFDASNDSVAGSARSLVDALPEHRIEYLKYRKRLVWHKQQRMDNMLGSRGGLTIRQVVDTYDAWDRDRRRRIQAAKARAVAALGGGTQGEAVLAAFKKELGLVLRGAREQEAFVTSVLSPAYFEASGYGLATDGSLEEGETEGGRQGSLRSEDAEGEAGGDGEADSEEEAPVAELLRTLPDERKALRDALLRKLSERGVRVGVGGGE